MGTRILTHLVPPSQKGKKILNRREHHTCLSQLFSDALFISKKGKDHMSIRYSLRGLSTGGKKGSPEKKQIQQCSLRNVTGAEILDVPLSKSTKPPESETTFTPMHVKTEKI